MAGPMSTPTLQHHQRGHHDDHRPRDPHQELAQRPDPPLEVGRREVAALASRCAARPRGARRRHGNADRDIGRYRGDDDQDGSAGELGQSLGSIARMVTRERAGTTGVPRRYFGSLRLHAWPGLGWWTRRANDGTQEAASPHGHGAPADGVSTSMVRPTMTPRAEATRQAARPESMARPPLSTTMHVADAGRSTSPTPETRPHPRRRRSPGPDGGARRGTRRRPRRGNDSPTPWPATAASSRGRSPAGSDDFMRGPGRRHAQESPTRPGGTPVSADLRTHAEEQVASSRRTPNDMESISARRRPRPAGVGDWERTEHRAHQVGGGAARVARRSRLDQQLAAAPDGQRARGRGDPRAALRP